MSAFAPSYHHENNNAWLNSLVGDIIEQRSQSRSRARTRDDSKEPYDDLAQLDQDIDDETQPPGSRKPHHHGRASPATAHQDSQNFHRSMRSPSIGRFARHSYCGSISPTSYHSSTEFHNRVTSAHDGRIGPIVEHSHSLSLDPFHNPTRASSPDLHISPIRQTNPDSQAALTSSSDQSPTQTGTDGSTLAHSRVPDRLSSLSAKRSSARHRARQASDWAAETGVAASYSKPEQSGRVAPSRTSIGRTMTEKRFHDSIHKPPLPRIASNATDVTENTFTGFSPHPAIRLYHDREKLSEAAGPDEGHDDHEYPKPLPLALIVIGICLSVFIISVDRNIVTTITETFRSYSDIGWYGSAYFMTASAFQPLYGRVYMSFDTRWSFLYALAVFEIGSLLGALSPNSEILILGRAVQGLGSAGILTGSFVVGTHSVPLHGRPVLFAFVGILYGVGALAGPLLGGVFTDLLTWRWAFWINLPIGAVTFVGIFFFFKPRKNTKLVERESWLKRILALDLIGNAILLVLSVMLFLALQMSETGGSWDSAPVIGLLCGGGVGIFVFIAWLIYRGDKALIPPRIIRQRTVAASCGVAFFLYGGLLIHAYYLPIWFQAIKGDSAIQSGINMIPYMVANALFSLMAGIFVSKNGLFAPPAIIGCAIGTIGCGLISTLSATTSTAAWVGYEILVSAGLGMAIQQGFSAVQTALPLEQVPIGTAAVVACQSLGGAVFVSIGNTILQNHLLSQNEDNAVPGVNIRAVFEMGATMFRGVVPEESLPALIALYNRSLQFVFITSIPLIGCAFLCALCMEWKSVKVKQEVRELDQEEAGAKG